MKIAAVTDDGKTVSLHFGRAQSYAVYTVEDGQIVAQELRDKPSHHHAGHEHRHEHGQHEHGAGAEKHRQMLAPIEDCEALLARGMGHGAYQALQTANIKPIVTDIPAIEDAVQAYIQGDIVDHTEKLH
jgi:predicted Fe-Mo cluster-binding NifX family protein